MNLQQRAAMQMALRELRYAREHGLDCGEVIEELDLALAQPQEPTLITRIAVPESNARVAQPQGEPVDAGLDAYMHGFEVGRDSCLAGINAQKPKYWTYMVNSTWRKIETECPPDDSYDEGTLEPLYTAPPSVEAAIEATKEKAAKVLDKQIVKLKQVLDYCEADEADDIKSTAWQISVLAAAIRSMK